jgi:hypothetical protein
MSLFLLLKYDYEYDDGYVDPNSDRDFDRQQSNSEFSFVPDAIKKFLSYFRDMINEGNGFEVANLYEVSTL